MPFFLDGNPTTSEISEAVNYLLGNFPVGNTVNPDTGQVVKPGGEVYGYIYKYMAIKYADSYDGSVGFSNTPTGKAYYGLRNSDTSSESNNPADYVWYEATGGFGSFKFLWYISTGGRQIKFEVATSAPDAGWLQDPGTAIDLDVVTSGNIPVVAETFFGYFSPASLQVPRTGNPLAPVFTSVIAKLYATDGGVVIPFVDAQSDSASGFTNGTWRIGASSTTGNADISYTNVTVGSPTDAGDFAQWPAPTAMSSSPAYISVPIRYKNSLGIVSQASVANLQLVFADPGAAGQDSPYVDISGYTGFSVNTAGTFSPANTTLSAVTTSITSPTYAWSITGGTPTSSTNSSVVVTPNAAVGSISVTLTVSGTNIASPLSKTITMPVVYQGTPGQAGANGVMSAYPQIYRWTSSSTPPGRPTTTSTYTWATGAYTAPTDWYTTAPTNTTPGNFLWSITVPVTTTATTTTSTLDWTDVNYPIRAIAYNGTNGNNGNNASVLTLASTSQTFTYGRDGDASPASQTISFTANLQNLTGTATFVATNYDVNGNALGNPTLGGTGNTKTLTIGNFDVAAYCVVSATLSGYTDQITVIRLQDGLNTTSGYLTNESVTIQTNSSGGGGVFTNAGGTFKVYNGTTDVTTSSTFSLVSSSGVTISIVADTGVYAVSAMSADQGTATLQAVYGDVTLTKIYSIAKSKAGVSASVLTLTQTAQTFTYDGDGNASPSAQTILFTANTVNLSPTVGTPVTFAGTKYNSAGASLGAVTFTNVGVTSAELTIANFGAAAYCVVTASFSGYADQTTIYRLSSGTDGTSPIVGLLTNEAVTLQADNSGAVTSFAPGSGNFLVYEGITNVTASATFSVASSTNVTVSINSSGAYSISAMSASYGSATFRAVYGGVTVDKIYSVSKSIAGADGSDGLNAQVLYLSASSQSFTYNGSGTASPSSQTITFAANLQNLSGTATFVCTLYNAAGSSLGTVTLGGSGNTRTLTNTQFATASYAITTATLSGYSDTITVVKLQDGSNGTNGENAVVGLLTNEAVTLQADNSGSVTSFAPGSGNFIVYNGLTDVTSSSTFSVASSTNVTVSINAAGAYSISAMSANYGTATFRAVYGSVTIDKIYNVAKSIAGANGSNGLNAQVLYLSASSQSFTYNGSGTATPSSQTITFIANLQNLSGTATFVCTLYNAAGSSLGTVTLGGSGNTRTLTNTQFATASYAIITATLSGYSDTITVVKLQDGSNGTNGTDGTNGQNAVVGLLTNEAVTVAADSSGNVVSFSNAGGTFQVFYGLTDVTTSATFSVASYSAVTISINSSGVYAVTAMSASQATATLQAVYNGVTIQKVYNISKSLAGTNGSAGSPGSPGSATFLVTRAANDSSPPSNAEVTAAIGRNPVLGDIVTVNYNSGNNSIVYRYITSWVLQTTYITGSLIVENTITASKLSVTQLSAISQNVGDITAGSIAIGGITPSNISIGNIWNFNGLATTANMLDVVYVTSSAMWVAVGSGGASWYRAAGSATWNYVYTGYSADFYSVATNGTGLVSISGNTTIIGTISGGVLSWAASTGSQRANTTLNYRVIYVSSVNRYFTFSLLNLWYSNSSGNSWQSTTNPGNAVACAFDGALLWACSYSSGNVYNTTLTDNGTTVTVSWSASISTGGSNGATRDFVYLGGRFVLVGTAVRTSTSGASGTWSGTSSYPGINRVGYFNNLFYGVGSSSGNSVIWQSSNGFQSSSQLIDGPTQVLNAVAFGPSEGITVGNTGTYAITQLEDSWTGSGTSINTDGAFFTGSVGGSISFDGTALTLDVPFLQNRQTITTSVIVKQNYNALSVGKVTISDTADVTVPSGSVWVIL